MKAAITILLALTWCSLVVGAEPNVRVRVDFLEQRGCESGACQLVKTFEKSASGVVVYHAGGVAKVLTNRHVIEDDDRPQATKRPYVLLGGQWVRGKITHQGLVNEKRNMDLALIEAPYGGRDVSAAALSSAAPASGESVFLRSFVRGEQFTEQEATAHPSALVDTQFASARVVQGQSGGGVYNSRNELVGVIWGFDGRPPRASNMTTFVQLTCVRKFLGFCRVPVSRGPPVRPPVQSKRPTPTNCQPQIAVLTAQIEELKQRIAELEARKPPEHSHKITIKLAKDGKIVDAQVYDLDEPIVLDFRKFTRGSDAR